MDMSNGGKWVKHNNNHDHAYKLLLAYALTQQHYWMGREDGWMKILQEHGWNGDRSTALAAMGDLQSRALEAAKEAP